MLTTKNKCLACNEELHHPEHMQGSLSFVCTACDMVTWVDESDNIILLTDPNGKDFKPSEFKMNDTEKIVELTNLAKQYRSDCETRIDCLISEKIDLVTDIDQETFDRFGSDGITDDVDAQIGHWQATIKGIDTMLEKVK